MSKGEQLQRAVEWIIDNEMEDKFCTVRLFDDVPVVSFLELGDMVEKLHGQTVQIIGTEVKGFYEFEVKAFGMLFTCSTSLCSKGPGTYTLNKSILKPELVA